MIISDQISLLKIEKTISFFFSYTNYLTDKVKKIIKKLSKYSKKTEMDKYNWKQVKTLSSSSHKPSSRWGHSCCVVG